MRAKKNSTAKKSWIDDVERLSADDILERLERAVKMPEPVDLVPAQSVSSMYFPSLFTFLSSPPVIGTVEDGGKVVPIGPKLVEKSKDEYDDHVPLYQSAMYISSFIDPKELKVQVDLSCRVLRTILDQFDTIAFSGMSGTLIGPPVAMALGKEVLMVRKEGQSSHSSYLVEGNYGTKKFMIIDDLRSSGATEDYIIQQIKKVAPLSQYAGFFQAGAGELWESLVRDYELGKRPFNLLPKGGYNF